MRARDGGVETVGGVSSETGLVMKVKKNRRPVSVPASPLTTVIKRRCNDNSCPKNHVQLPVS